MGGVACAVSPAWDLYGEVRWFGTDGGEFEGKDHLSFESTFDSLDLLVGAAYKF